MWVHHEGLGLIKERRKKKEGRKQMFYLTTHSTHFVLRLHVIGDMVEDHSDSERGNHLPPHGR